MEMMLKYPYVKVGCLGFIMLLISLIARIPYHPIRTVIAFCILEFIVGWLSVAINIKTITTIQIFVQDDFRGQVIGTLTAVSYSLIPISLLLAGTAVDMVESYVIPLICGSLLNKVQPSGRKINCDCCVPRHEKNGWANRFSRGRDLLGRCSRARRYGSLSSLLLRALRRRRIEKDTVHFYRQLHVD